MNCKFCIHYNKIIPSEICSDCDNYNKYTEHNSMKLLKDFILEFHPFYTKEYIENCNYEERLNIIQELLKDI